MSMNNEQQPTYEELVQAYTNAVKAIEDARIEIQAVRTDKMLEKLNTMLNIIYNKDKYPKKLYKLAIWHAEQIMSKPKA